MLTSTGRSHVTTSSGWNIHDRKKRTGCPHLNGKTHLKQRRKPMKISVIKIKESTTVDGPGLRTSVYCAGCTNACPGCHNPQTWDINAGTMMDVEDIMTTIVAEDFCNVTFTGGDPMYQAKGFAELARRIKSETAKNIWCYTGYTFEACLADKNKLSLLELVDVLVDGRYIQSLRNTDLLFRGSENQRIIDVQKSLRSGHVVLHDPSQGLLPEI